MKLQIGIEGKTYEVDIEMPEEESAGHSYASYRPSYAPAPTFVPSAAPAAAAPKAAPSDANVDEDKVCRSPIAGIVIRLNAQIGQQLQPNDLLLVLEAMKMETNVTAPVGGKIKTINVQPGDGVQVNQVLVEFE
ncbi:MAG TPA: biotin/lipoyl-containing protein [Clostridia bacterium]|nr:biotin/lipoyl-containing protein [Clostridia bacterium]